VHEVGGAVTVAVAQAAGGTPVTVIWAEDGATSINL
jgi:hypothetical protein